MRRRLVLANSVRTARGEPGDALLIEEGRVAEIGRADRLRRPELPEERYPGGVIVPGFRDAHFHPFPYAAVMGGPGLGTARNLAEVLERLAEEAAALAPGQALVARRLDEERLAEVRLPTREDLDRRVGDRPVLVYRYCGHVGVANTLALDLAGVGPGTPDPEGGSFDRDEGEVPDGVLRETALELVARALPIRTSTESVWQAMQALPTLGLTSLGAMVSVEGGPLGTEIDELGVLEEIAALLPLKLAVLVIAAHPAALEEAAGRLERMGPRVRFLGMKDFADGSLGGHTAALRSPYHDRPDRSGTMRLRADRTGRLARTSLALGGLVAVHAIGDLANARVLELFGELLDEGTPPERLRIEHASVLGDEEIEGLARSGVTASIQPAFLPSETELLSKRLGAERVPLAYRFRTLAQAGVPLAGGSDCPVEPPWPLWGMAAARHRAGIVPEEALSPIEALALFTDGAARALDEAEPLGQGSPADFVVLDRDPVEAREEELADARILATWVDGQPVPFPTDAVSWRG